jgi:hypothetical protein
MDKPGEHYANNPRHRKENTALHYINVRSKKYIKYIKSEKDGF